MKKIFPAVLLLFLTGVYTLAQATNGSLRGRVVDSFGAVVLGAEVTAAAAGGTERRAVTNQAGEFTINLPPGTYVIRATSQGFALYENAAVEIAAGRATALDITLTVAAAQAEVTVGNDDAINTNPESNASALVLTGQDIEALPDNEDDLEAALRALAGPGAGPDGGEIFVDGFSNGRVPPRDTIREVRVNQNPFSSEYDRLGFGRIEILTKPGTDELRGELEFEFEDESFNSRNPFSPNRAPFQVREFSGNVGGPLVKKRASYFVDFQFGDTADNALVNAIVLDNNLNAVPFRQLVARPNRDLRFSPRFDYQINETNTLVARYEFSRSTAENSGLGGFDLPTRGFRQRSLEHSFRLTHTAVFAGSIVNESRGQYVQRRNRDESDADTPTIRVLDAFTGGGAGFGFAFANEDRLELQNFTSLARGDHALKFGARLRYNRLENASPANFAGTFTFTSLDQYRDTIRNLPGALPTQFTIAGGEPEAKLAQWDAGLFVQDDWRVSPQLTLSFGLRYENQTNISSNFNFAPRFGFAWSPGANGQNRPKTVLRGGFGIFYDRFAENLSLQAVRFNGISQQQYIVTDPAILDAVIFTTDGAANIPTVARLAAFAQRQTTRAVATDLQAPYTMQTALSVERQLPFRTTVSATYLNAQTRNLLRSRNINAPLGGIRPNPLAGNIFQYESTGRFNQNQLILNARSSFARGVTIFANYALNRAKSDSDGAFSFPANSFDLAGEYGAAALDVRHRFVVGGNFPTVFGVRLSPFVTFRSGVPFNITTGSDENGDSIFAERPTFARLASACGARGLNTAFCRLDGRDPNAVIPRNYGRASEFFIVNLRATKEFGFGGKKENGSSQSPQGGGGNRGGINNPFGGGGWGGGGGDSRYSVEFSVQVRNLFNRTNFGVPVGNLRSPFFGEPTALAGGFGFGGGGAQAGNRRLEVEVEFNF